MDRTALDARFSAALLSRIEDAGLNAAAPPQQLWIDGWLVRLSPGKAKRARCINALANGQLSLDERLAACESHFDTARLPLIVRITPFTVPQALDDQLAARGLQRFDDTRVMVLTELPSFENHLPAGLSMHALDLDAFAERVGGLRSSPSPQRRAHAERLVTSPVSIRAFDLRAADEPVACGHFALEGQLVGLYDVVTAEPARGRGHATALCMQLLSKARGLGARHAYLQVDAGNAAARRIYERLGFVDAYAYHYRTREPSAA